MNMYDKQTLFEKQIVGSILCHLWGGWDMISKICWYQIGWRFGGGVWVCWWYCIYTWYSIYCMKLAVVGWILHGIWDDLHILNIYSFVIGRKWKIKKEFLNVCWWFEGDIIQYCCTVLCHTQCIVWQYDSYCMIQYCGMISPCMIRTKQKLLYDTVLSCFLLLRWTMAINSTVHIYKPQKNMQKHPGYWNLLSSKNGIPLPCCHSLPFHAYVLQIITHTS